MPPMAENHNSRPSGAQVFQREKIKLYPKTDRGEMIPVFGDSVIVENCLNR